MKKILLPLAIIGLVIQLFACHTQLDRVPAKGDASGFIKKFYSQRNDEYKLLLGSFIYAQKSRNKLNWDDRDAFLALAVSFQHKWGSAYSNAKLKSANAIDSVVQSYVLENKDIDFTTVEAYSSISHFVECYNMVEDLAFVKIKSDTDEYQMGIADKKILSIAGLNKIHKLYMTNGRQGMSSLEFAEGVAFYTQVAYYLNLQTDDRRAEIIKELL